VPNALLERAEEGDGCRQTCDRGCGRMHPGAVVEHERVDRHLELLDGVTDVGDEIARHVNLKHIMQVLGGLVASLERSAYGRDHRWVLRPLQRRERCLCVCVRERERTCNVGVFNWGDLSNLHDVRLLYRWGTGS
jgi:hypothetical protein